MLAGRSRVPLRHGVQESHDTIVTDQPSRVLLTWRAGGRLDARESDDRLWPDPASGERAFLATVWINDAIDRFQVRLAGRDAWEGVRLTVLAAVHR